MGVVYVSAEGRVSVDVLIHDTSGSALNVVSLGGVASVAGDDLSIVAITTKTIAAGQQVTLNVANDFAYRDASGNVPAFANLTYLAFRFVGPQYGLLTHDLGQMAASGDLVATSISDGNQITVSSPGSSGTYTIVALGQY